MEIILLTIMTSLNLIAIVGLVVPLIIEVRGESRRNFKTIIESSRVIAPDISKSLEESTHQLEFIDYTILSLVSMKISNNKILNKPIDMKNIDKDVKNLSMDVMNSINPDFFDSETSFYKKDFLMKYIIDKSKITLIEAYRQSHLG